MTSPAHALTCGYVPAVDRLFGPAVLVSGENKRPRAALVTLARGLADREGVDFAER